MGCFLACFGLSKKRKRRKTLYKVLAAAAAGGHGHGVGKYEALKSSATVNLAIPDNPIIPYYNFRDECKEQTRVKSRKKVSFNLNVQIYEPNPTAYRILKSDEAEENEKDNGEMEKSSSSSSILGENKAAMNYPSNYRYYNCIDSYNEEDEIANEEYDVDEYDDDDDDEFDDEDGWDFGNSDGNEEEDQAKVYSQNTVQNQSSEPICSSPEEDRIRSHLHSVLSPVENLTQWKAIKAKVASSKHRRKENVPFEQKTSMILLSEPGSNLLKSDVLQSKPLLTEIAVDASLSNWLISPNVPNTTIHCQ